jgi:hypothetical protein
MHSLTQYKNHVNGLTHKAALREQAKSQQQPTSSSSGVSKTLRCELCDTATMSSQGQYQDHMNGKKHKMAVRQQAQRQKQAAKLPPPLRDSQITPDASDSASSACSSSFSSSSSSISSSLPPPMFLPPTPAAAAPLPFASSAEQDDEAQLRALLLLAIAEQSVNHHCTPAELAEKAEHAVASFLLEEVTSVDLLRQLHGSDYKAVGLSIGLMLAVQRVLRAA